MSRRTDQESYRSSSDESKHTYASSPSTSSGISSPPSSLGTSPPLMRTARPATTISQTILPRQPAELSLTRQARGHAAVETTASVYIRLLDRNDYGGSPFVSRGRTQHRACEFAIKPDIRVSKYTVYGLRAAANGSLWPDLEDDARSLHEGQDTPFRVIFVSRIPGQRVPELEELVLRAAGRRDVPNSESWVRSCLDKMVRVGIMTGREKEDALQGMMRAGCRR